MGATEAYNESVINLETEIGQFEEAIENVVEFSSDTETQSQESDDSSPTVLATPARITRFRPFQLVHIAAYASNQDLLSTGSMLLVSCCCLMIGFPIYAKQVQNSPLVYTFPTGSSSLMLLVYVWTMRKLHYMDPDLVSPLPIWRLLQIVLTFGVGYLMVIYSQIDDHIPCNVQDPLKSVLVIFSLIFYYLYTKKNLGFQNIFSLGMISIGLLIAMEYGFCNVNKCREEDYVWSSQWELRVLWTIVYMIGLGMFSLAFTILEQHLIQRPLVKLASLTSVISTISVFDTSEETTNYINSTTDSNINATNQDSTTANASSTDGHVNSTPDLPCANRFLLKLKMKSILVSMWIQLFLCVLFLISGAIFIYFNFTNIKIENNSRCYNLEMLTCHIPGVKSTDQFYVFNSFDSIYTSPFEYLNFQRVPNDSGNSSEMLEFTNITMNEEETVSRKKRAIAVGKSKRLKRRKMTLKLAKKLMSSMNGAKNGKNRTKRMANQFNAMGFKIIHPTDSILQGHVITNKQKPDLIGHVILNKTDANLNGHKITYKQDLFMREHDPQPSKMHRMHRNRQEVRFSSNLANITESDIGTSVSVYNTSSKRTKRQIGLDQIKISSHKNTKRKTGELPVILAKYSTFLYKYLPEDGTYRKIPVEMFIVDDEIQGPISSFTVSYEDWIGNSSISNIDSTLFLLKKGCGYTAAYGWMMAVSFTVFSVTSVRFLVLTQSSIFTIAMMSPALPLSEIWWAVFSVDSDGNLTMQPGLNSEMMYGLFGLPFIALGLTLLVKAHLMQNYICAVTRRFSTLRFGSLSDESSDDSENSDSSVNDLSDDTYTVESTH